MKKGGATWTACAALWKFVYIIALLKPGGKNVFLTKYPQFTLRQVHSVRVFSAGRAETGGTGPDTRSIHYAGPSRAE